MTKTEINDSELDSVAGGALKRAAAQLHRPPSAAVSSGVSQINEDSADSVSDEKSREEISLTFGKIKF